MTGFWSEVGRRLAGKPEETVEEQRQPRAPEPRVILGLDFGTSGSKVVVRDIMRRQEDPMAVDFRTPPDLGFGRFVFPSTVAIRDGKLLFGGQAERESEECEVVVRSLKRQFLNLSGTATGDRSTLDGVASAIQDSGGAVEEFLATAYLAAVLRRSMEALSERYPGIRDEEVIVHLDVPVASFREHSHEKKVFFRMLRFARVLAKQFPESPDAVWAGQEWLSLKESPPPLPPRGEGREDLVPEAVAAIAGLGESVKKGRPDRNLVIVDVGAGTTDLGIFRYPERAARRAVFYAAKTSPVGCDDLDREICKLLGLADPSPNDLNSVRVQKTKLSAGETSTVNGAPVTEEIVDQAVVPLKDRSKKLWKRTFGEAYGKEKSEERWHALDVFVVGGGSNVEGFRRIYRDRPWNRVRDVSVRTIEQNVSLDSLGGDGEPPSERDMVFLMTALGLSLPPLERPDLVHPDDVPTDPGYQGRGPTGLYDFNADDMWLD